jgi:hypothetical protein
VKTAPIQAIHIEAGMVPATSNDTTTSIADTLQIESNKPIEERNHLTETHLGKKKSLLTEHQASFLFFCRSMLVRTTVGMSFLDLMSKLQKMEPNNL